MALLPDRAEETVIEFVYLAGVVYCTLVAGETRRSDPKSFAFDLVTVGLVMLWPAMLGISLLTRKRT